MNFFFQLLVSGIMLGGVYSLVALGFVIIYKSTGVINFAQGQLLAIGALIVWSFMVPLGMPFWVAGLLSVLCGASLGIVIERLTIRPMTGQPLMAVIVMTIALATFLDSAIPPIFGSEEEAFPTLLPTGGLYVWAARSCGVRVGTIFSTAWAIAAVSAMAGGFLLGNIESVSPSMSTIALRVFPVIILGGLDSITGCIIAGPIVGALEMMAVGYADPITEGGAGEVVPHLIILITLIFRPHGIFGQEHIERI
ncbi:MAG: branched-chain amino acid ABC transporter permease [Deltaproteobacteria bacterium]